MWVYTFFPGEAGAFPHKCCLDGRGERRGCFVSLSHRPMGEEMLLNPLCCVQTTQVGVGGVRELPVVQWGGDRRWLMLLGGSRAVTSVHCQNHHESLCQRMAMQEFGTALKGLPWVCSSVCRYEVGSASQILGSFLHWPQSLCCECAHCISPAGSMLALLHPFQGASSGQAWCTQKDVAHFFSSAKLSLHVGCLWKEMCRALNLLPFAVYTREWRLPTPVHGVKRDDCTSWHFLRSRSTRESSPSQFP